MENKIPGARKPSELRQLAEKQVQTEQNNSIETQNQLSLENLRTQNHELRVYQVELEMQNEELRRIRAELEVAHARYFDLYDLAPVGYVTLSEHGLILEANTTIATMLGVARNGLVKQSINRFIREEDQDRYYVHRKQLFVTGQPQTCELRMVNVDDMVFWARLDDTVTKDADDELVSRVAISDITERKRAEEVMIHAAKMIGVNAMATTMAHDIHNPLVTIAQRTRALLSHFSSDTPLNGLAPDGRMCSLEDIRTYLEKHNILEILKTIQEAGERAARTVSNLVELSRRDESRRSATDMNLLLDKMVEQAASDEDLKKTFDFRKIQITRDYDQNLPTVQCSQAEIELVVLNLLKNAVQAMAQQQNRTSVPSITLRSMREGEFIRIEVEDTGPGISETERKRIFEPFYTTKPMVEGTGLGLSLSYLIITKNHRGSIEVNSAPGKGALFIIKLPIAQSVHADVSELPL